MLRLLRFAAIVVTISIPAASWCQQTDPNQEKQDAASTPQNDSIAAAARKAREQKKESSKAPKVFTNENIPTSGGISSVGDASTAGPAGGATGAAANASNEEKAWRDRFAKLNHKLDQDKQDLDVMQRELGVLNVQYYNDPVKAMQQQLTRDDINKKTADIEAKKKDIEADQQAIDDAQDELHKAGGDPGWAR
jgi:DNA repair exonuclease SbcCD ATPase subunit